MRDPVVLDVTVLLADCVNVRVCVTDAVPDSDAVTLGDCESDADCEVVCDSVANWDAVSLCERLRDAVLLAVPDMLAVVLAVWLGVICVAT